MTAVLRPLREAATYRSLLFLSAALPLGVIESTLLLTGWGLTLLFLITPLVVALLIGLRAAVGGVAAVEAALARSLLGAKVGRQQTSSGGQGYWSGGKAVIADGSFWRQQGYVLLRWLVGTPLAIAVLALLGSALYVVGMPIYYRWTQTDATGLLRIDTLQKAVLVMPLGAAAFVLFMHLIRPLGTLWRKTAESMLETTEQRGAQDPAVTSHRRTRALRLHAGVTLAVLAVLVIVWALTGGPFWPIWPILALGLLLAIHASIVLAAENQELVRRYGLTTAAAANLGVTTSFSLFYILIWAASGGGYFWPIWPILALGLILVVQILVVRSQRSSRHELQERIETLETTRAGAVDVQDTELRRIERDLHDGAQARLVALGMNLGMAEQKLAGDPDAARELVSEARAGIEEALRELRDLARGIHPPVLTDRGLEAAISALADRSAIPVTVTADVPDRPAGAVESAAYFVAAEALTNAAKHADASKVDVRIVRRPKSLVVEVSDDGRGGANSEGSGLSGLRRRVEALDGTLLVVSPPDGGTTLRAELPCAS
jgi:signal transduction histidine kinase